MAFFRKKEPKVEAKVEPKVEKELPPKKGTQSLQEILRDRVLTAEGWQRRTLSKVALQGKKVK